MRHAAGLTAIAALSLLAASCAGYRLGDAKPAHLASIRAIHVPQFRNATLEPRLESLATNETVAAFQRDGTYQVSNRANSDAILEATVESLDYNQLIANRIDTRRPLELRNIIRIKWTLKDARQPDRVIDHGVAAGSSTLFVDPNLQTARINALPEATRNAARTLVSHLADGF